MYSDTVKSMEQGCQKCSVLYFDCYDGFDEVICSKTKPTTTDLPSVSSKKYLLTTTTTKKGSESFTTEEIKSNEVVQNNDYSLVINDRCPKCSDLYFDCYDQSDEPVCPTTTTKTKQSTDRMQRNRQARKPTKMTQSTNGIQRNRQARKQNKMTQSTNGIQRNRQARNQKCIESNTLYTSKPFSTILSTNSAAKCRDLCMKSSRCHIFVWYSPKFEKKGLRNKCVLKSSLEKAEVRANVHSGLKNNC